MKCKWCNKRVHEDLVEECYSCWETRTSIEYTGRVIALRMLAELVEKEIETIDDRTSTEPHDLTQSEWDMIMLDADKLEMENVI